ncbi:MAG: hypothetical protein AAF357_08670, partial [Verrucomicrobiota bacterium]
MPSSVLTSLPAALSIAVIPLLCSCKVTDVSDEEQSASLAPYADHKIENATLNEYFGGRTAFLIGADDVEVTDSNQDTLSEDPTRIGGTFSMKLRSGSSVEIGTAAAIDQRGYFVTAGHCVEGREMYALYFDGDGNMAIEKIRVIWSRVSSLPEIDFALFHVERKLYQTLQWAESFEIE